MLAEPEDVETHLIGKLDFLQEVLQAPLPFPPLVGGVGIDIGEGIEAKFHGMFQRREVCPEIWLVATA